MAHYRNLLMARQDVTPQQVESLFETYKGVVERNGGRLENVERWGVRSLAYRIKKNRKAHFALLAIDGPPAAIAEMERQMQISEDVLNFMTVRVEDRDSERAAMVPARGHADSGDGESASEILQAELNTYSRDILQSLRDLNDDIEARL